MMLFGANGSEICAIPENADKDDSCICNMCSLLVRRGLVFGRLKACRYSWENARFCYGAKLNTGTNWKSKIFLFFADVFATVP